MATDRPVSPPRSDVPSQRPQDAFRPPEHPAEERESLWWIAAAPAIWALHFLVCYVGGAIHCARAASRAASLGPVEPLIAITTVVALVGIGAIAAHGLRRHRFGSAAVPHDFDTPGDRHRFLGFATLLLAGLSAVATLFVAAVGLFFESCL